MTSDRKRQSNRSNAERSTGPRSKRGKLRSSQNATRHGLTVHRPVGEDQRRARDLVERLVGADAPSSILFEAELVADAVVRLEAIGVVNASLFGEIARTGSDKLVQQLTRIDRYEVRAMRRLEKSIERLSALLDVIPQRA